MKLEKLQDRCTGLLADGERLLAAAKATPRGSANEAILGAAGGVAGSTISPALAGAGLAAGTAAGEATGAAGRAERETVGVDVGRATQVVLAVTDRRIVLLSLSAFGRPKAVLASLERAAIADVVMGETRLFGQKMSEIVLTTTDGHEVGFGVAKVHRGDGQAVVEALSG